MAIFHVADLPDFQVLTRPNQGRKYSKNGYAQVGNKLLPTNEISADRITSSAIYNKNISKFGLKGISEAGYGRAYPYRHLSYGGAGSYGAAGSRLGYAGAGSQGAAGSSRLGYAGSGSQGAAGSRLGYSGAGSYGASGSRLRDAYINDNPGPGALRRRGLSDGEGFFDTLTSAFSTVTKQLVGTVVTEGSTAANKAVTNAINPPPEPPKPIVTTVSKIAHSTGLSTNTLLLGAAGLLGAYFLIRR